MSTRWPYYLPTDPCCNPCSNACTDPCQDPAKQSDNLAYPGPNLPCTGIDTCDSLTTALQKIEDKLCKILSVMDCDIEGTCNII